MSKRTITIEIDADAAAYLAVLTHGGTANAKTIEDVVLHLVHSAVDGVRRPGAWERSWVVQAFADDWLDELIVDPKAPHRRVPRSGR